MSSLYPACNLFLDRSFREVTIPTRDRPTMFATRLRSLLPRARTLAAAGGCASMLAGGALAANGTPALCEYKAPQRSNPAWKAQMQAGKLMMGCAVSASSTLVTELVASMGYDFILIDAQHSAISVENLRHMICAVQAGGSKAVIRVGAHLDGVGIQQSFDLGADG